MRHNTAGRKLGRTTASRLALFRNQIASLVSGERIVTTLPKAKELRPIAERDYPGRGAPARSRSSGGGRREPEQLRHTRRAPATGQHLRIVARTATGDGAEMAALVRRLRRGKGRQGATKASERRRARRRRTRRLAAEGAGASRRRREGATQHTQRRRPPRQGEVAAAPAKKAKPAKPDGGAAGRKGKTKGGDHLNPGRCRRSRRALASAAGLSFDQLRDSA
jgi:hypothetical protein